MRDDTKLPTIGIISPSFNQGAFIGAMLSSIESQTLQPAEHILLDPGSKDNSREQILAYAQRNKFAKAVLEPDKGQVDAINRGLKASTADVLTWLNTDDLYTDPDALRAVAEIFAAEPDVDVVYAGGRFVDPSGKKLRDAFINAKPELLELELTHSVGILQPALFFRRRVVDQHGLMDENRNFAFDYEYWIRLIKRGARFHHVDRQIVDATLHENSKTQGQRHRQYSESVSSVHEHYGFVPVKWLRRLAEFEICSIDGILLTTADVPTQAREQVQRRVGELQQQWNSSVESYRKLLCRPVSGPGSYAVSETIEDLRTRNMIPTDKLVVTSFDSAYFNQGLNLIASLHRLGESACSLIVVYDLGLTPAQREKLADLDRVAVRDYPVEVSKYFDGYMSAKNYSYKCAAIHAASRLVNDGDRVLWIDAGVSVFNDLEEVFELIKRDDAFFVNHDDKPGWPFLNATFTHPEAAKRMGCTGRELLSPHLCSCMLGFKKGSRAQKLVDDALVMSQDPKIVAWPKHLDEGERRTVASLTAEQRASYTKLLALNEKGETTEAQAVLAATPYLGHRQDQSIYSILCSRYGFPQSSASRYCWSNDASSKASLENWRSGGESNALQRSRHAAIPESALTFHHRGIYNNLDGLRLSNLRHTLVVLGNGPSLRDFDFASLDDFDTIGMNAAYRYWDRIGWYPTYYCCMDKVVILSHKEAILRMIREHKRNGIRKFFLRSILADACPEIRDHPAVVLLEDERPSYSALAVKDITTGNFSALFGATLGYKRMLLLGIDCNYVEQISEAKAAGGTKLEIAATPSQNPNYFFDDYQQSGDVYNIPNVTPGFHAGSWVETEQVLTAMGVQVFNANHKSSLDVFPFADLSDPVMETVRESELLNAGVLVAEFTREAKARVEELDLIREAIGFSQSGDWMVDVGAHHGGSSHAFVDGGWRVLAFEPDPANRERAIARLGHSPRFTIDPRAVSDAPKTGVPLYSTQQSSGATSLAAFTPTHSECAIVEVTTLDVALSEHDVDHIRVLKIDAEGFDKQVLDGFPWDRMRPSTVMCEFEDRKTLPIGYSTAELAELLIAKGYTVFASEWHPIVRYGVRHDWKRMFVWGETRPHDESWGNLIAFLYPADARAFKEVVRRVIVEGQLTADQRREHTSPLVSKVASAQQVTQATADGKPVSQAKPAQPENEFTRTARELVELAQHASQTQPAGLSAAPLLAAPLPWAPKAPGALTLKRHLTLSIGKIGRVYLGRAGVLAACALACWGVGVGSLAFGQPLWFGLALAGSAFIPLFTLIALIAITARKQSFENCETLRHSTEHAIRNAGEHLRGQHHAASSYTNGLIARACGQIDALEKRRMATRTDLHRLINSNSDQTTREIDQTRKLIQQAVSVLQRDDQRLAEMTKTQSQAALKAAQAAATTAADARALAEKYNVVATAARTDANTARTDATAALRGQEATMKAVGELAKEATAGVRRASEAAQSASELVVVNKRATDQALTEAATRLGARIDESSTMLSRLRGDAYTQFSRVLTPALEQGALELGLKLKPGEFRYLERKLQVIEGLCEGRLAGSVDDAVARTLAARTWTGQEVRVLEIGVLFGVGAIFMHQTLQPFFERVQLTLLDPFDGYYGPSHLDPLTGQRVTRSMVERNLRRCSIPAEDCAIIDKFSTDPVALQAAKAQGPFAVVIIDGDHSREGVQADYELYADLVAPGGILIVDDYGSKDWPAVTAYTREVIEEDARFKRISVLGKTAVFRRAVAVKAAQARSTEPKPKKNDKVRQAEAVANTTDDALPFSD